LFEVKPARLKSFSMREIDQVKLDRISQIIDTGETYTTTAGEIVHVKRVIKA
jgi:hypothetical protein